MARPFDGAVFDADVFDVDAEVVPQPDSETSVGHGVLFRRRNRIKGFVGISDKPALPEVLAFVEVEQPLHQVSARAAVFDSPELQRRKRNARILRVLAHC